MTLPALQIGPYRFAPALWPSVAFALVFPILLSLGYWQMSRAADKHELVEQRAATEIVAPIEIGSVTRLTVDDRYRPAVVRGHYVAEQQWLLDNRVYRGQPGYHVFTPFVIEGEQAPSLLINRGWVAVGETRAYLPLLPVPEQTVNLRGRLDSPASVGLVVG